MSGPVQSGPAGQAEAKLNKQQNRRTRSADRGLVNKGRLVLFSDEFNVCLIFPGESRSDGLTLSCKLSCWGTGHRTQKNCVERFGVTRPGEPHGIAAWASREAGEVVQRSGVAHHVVMAEGAKYMH